MSEIILITKAGQKICKPFEVNRADDDDEYAVHDVEYDITDEDPDIA